MKYDVRGTTLQILEMELEPGEKVYTESGGMAWKSPNVSMSTGTRGGLGKVVGRAFSGESIFLTTYEAQETTGTVSFCLEVPGKILEFDMSDGKELICQKDAFMVGEDSIDLKTEFVQRLGAGLFGGEGFFLQRVGGEGKVFLEIAGEITEYELEAGQGLEIDPGYIAAFEPTMKYDIRRVKGVTNMLFGGEGLFLAHLEGPGKVYLQSMPFSNLARKVARYVQKK